MAYIDRVVWIVLDSVGIGALPDAEKYGDEDSNTLKHVAEGVSNFSLPNLQSLGLGSVADIDELPPVKEPSAYYGKMKEKSPGKDTTTGHWELAGNILDNPFPVYPSGFPSEIVTEFENKIGKSILGNYPESGTKIIADLGEEHIKTGKPIVYTSADSVFQIAAHEDVIPPKELYEMCETAREILQGKHGVGRVIARPFEGEAPNFKRTERRKDFSLTPPDGNVLSLVKEQGLDVLAIGKIGDIFAAKGITKTYTTKSNTEGIEETIAAIQEDSKGLIMTNLVDFDMLYGHRNDPEGYYKALFEFDNYLPNILASLGSRDLLVITADHGCDPGHPGTDHTREFVPLLIYGESLIDSGELGVRESFADLGNTVAKILDVGETTHGEEFLADLKFNQD